MKDDNMKQRIEDLIRDGTLRMRPRAYFTLQLVAIAAISITILAITILLTNYISFSLRLTSQDQLLFFGPRGVIPFLRFFPWSLLAINIGLIIALESLVRRFRLGYRIPVLYLLAALLIVALGAGVLLDRGTPLNRMLHERALEQRLPQPLLSIYRMDQRPLPHGSGVCRCIVLSIEGNRLIVEDLRRGTTTLTVMLPPDDRRATTSGISVGDLILVAGEEVEGTIRAFGVRKIKPEDLPPGLQRRF